MVHFDQVDWRIILDSGTAAAAFQSGEVDWWEAVSGDFRPLLRRVGMTVATRDPAGSMRLNHLQPPFNDLAVRCALFKALYFMLAASAGDNTMHTVPSGILPAGTPMAGKDGIDVLGVEQDHAAARRELEAAGHKGERVVLLHATDKLSLMTLGDVAADMLKRAGLNVEIQAMDWGILLQRLQEGADRQGWLD